MDSSEDDFDVAAYAKNREIEDAYVRNLFRER
jgi:hypothetical protein